MDLLNTLHFEIGVSTVDFRPASAFITMLLHFPCRARRGSLADLLFSYRNAVSWIVQDNDHFITCFGPRMRARSTSRHPGIRRLVPATFNVVVCPGEKDIDIRLAV
jgi:hypothetical protein